MFKAQLIDMGTEPLLHLDSCGLFYETNAIVNQGRVVRVPKISHNFQGDFFINQYMLHRFSNIGKILKKEDIE